MRAIEFVNQCDGDLMVNIQGFTFWDTGRWRMQGLPQDGGFPLRAGESRTEYVSERMYSGRICERLRAVARAVVAFPLTVRASWPRVGAADAVSLPPSARSDGMRPRRGASQLQAAVQHCQLRQPAQRARALHLQKRVQDARLPA